MAGRDVSLGCSGENLAKDLFPSTAADGRLQERKSSLSLIVETGPVCFSKIDEGAVRRLW